MSPEMFAQAIVSIERNHGLRLDPLTTWLRMDATPCGRGWVGTKPPGCKRGEKASAVQPTEKTNTKPPDVKPNEPEILKSTLQRLKAKLEESIANDKAKADKPPVDPKKAKRTPKESSKGETPDPRKVPISAKDGIPKDFFSLREELQKPSQEILRLKADLSSAYDTERKSPKAAQKKKAARLISEIESQLKTARKKSEEDKTKLVVEYINKNKSDPEKQDRHGMSEPEAQWSVDLGGLKVHSAEKVNKDSAAVQFAVKLAGRKPPYPDEFLSHTTDVNFTAQKNSADEFWAARYKNPDHVSAATGGDGRVVVYNGKTMNLETFSHEAGHNFAEGLYGDMNPPIESYYAKSTQKLPEVSRYAENSIAESFAEDVSNYFDRAKGLNSMEKTNPERYKVIKAIIDGSKDAGYAKKTLADYR